MNQILSSQLTDGVYVTKPTYLDEKFILISPEIAVSDELMERLSRWGFDHLLSDGEIVTEPPTISTAATVESEDTPLAAIDQGRRDSQEMRQAQAVYNELIEFVEKMFANFLSAMELPMNPVQTRVKTVLEQLRERKRYLLRLPDLDPGPATNYIVDHAVKTTIVSVAVGMSMKLPPHKLLDIGTGAMLHEIGMIRLPSQLYMSDKELTEREKKAITTHPVLGFKILRQYNYPMHVCLSVLECRENVDGTGYPRGITTEKISTYAKIISAASTFAAMASARPYRKAIDGHTIMKTLLGGRDTRYDKDILMAAVATFSLFPYGTYVKLRSGHQAIVTDIKPDKPRVPHVRILTDPNGAPLAEQPVVDTDSEQHAVSGVLSHDEVARLNASL